MKVLIGGSATENIMTNDLIPTQTGQDFPFRVIAAF